MDREQGGPARGDEAIGLSNPAAIGAAFLEMTQRMMSDPARLVEAQVAFWNDYTRLWQQAAQRFLGAAAAEPIIEALPEDRRFRDQAWSDNALFDFIKQS
jgi:polyhydroxyalkanoate synthase subunit PhaC